MFRDTFNDLSETRSESSARFGRKNEYSANYVEGIQVRAASLLHNLKDDTPALRELFATIARLTPDTVPAFQRDLMKFQDSPILDELNEFVNQLFQEQRTTQLKRLQELFNFFFYGDTITDSIGSVFWETERTKHAQDVLAMDHRHADKEHHIKIPSRAKVRRYHFIPLYNVETPEGMENSIRYIGVTDFLASVDPILTSEPIPDFLRGYTNVQMAITALTLGFKVEDVDLILNPPPESPITKKIRIALTGPQSTDFLRKTRHARKINGMTNIKLQLGETIYHLSDELLAYSSVSVIQETATIDHDHLERLKRIIEQSVRSEIVQLYGSEVAAGISPESYSRGRMLLALFQNLRNELNPFGQEP